MYFPNAFSSNPTRAQVPGRYRHLCCVALLRRYRRKLLTALSSCVIVLTAGVLIAAALRGTDFEKDDCLRWSNSPRSFVHRPPG